MILTGGLSRRLVDGLYVEAMVMADEARAYFDGQGNADREALEVMARVGFSCESLKVTTRLMHVIAWLLTMRALHRGEIAARDMGDPKYHLGEAARSDAPMVAPFPLTARQLISASEDLYERVARLQARMGIGPRAGRRRAGSPARMLIDRLERAF